MKGLIARPGPVAAKCLVFQRLSTFFVSSENFFKKGLDGGLGGRYPLCIEGQGSRAAQLLASTTKQSHFGPEGFKVTSLGTSFNGHH